MNASRIAPYFELRLYRMLPTRMPEFHDLLGVQVPPLFARNGIPKPLAFWESHEGRLAPLFAYIIPWESVDERIAAWKRFYSDPVWIEKLAANYAGEQRVERAHVSILRASPLWDAFRRSGPARRVDGLHEMRIYRFSEADRVQAETQLRAVDLASPSAHGGHVLGLFDSWLGMKRNQIVVFRAWPDEASMLSAHSDAARRGEAGTSVFESVDSHVMKPIPYGVALTNLATGEPDIRE